MKNVIQKIILSIFAKRYIAGEEIEDAIKAAKKLNKDGLGVVIDNLGENVRTKKEAEENKNEYLRLLDRIDKEGVDSDISLKLTHLGLDVSDEVTFENAEEILKKAHSMNKKVCLDMEGSRYTQRIIACAAALREKYENIEIAIQSYLLRSREDIKHVIEKNISVRLVKGAYKEPPEIAYPEKKDVDKNYSVLMKELLLKGNYPQIATHDENLIKEAIGFIERHGIKKTSFEFQMLFGIKRSLQKTLAEKGYMVRVYVPYGKDWLPYTLRRLRERKENVWFVVKNLAD